MEQKNELFAIFRAVTVGTDDRKIVKRQLHLAKFGCGSGAILVIFSDFGLGQPKRHFLTHFFNFGHEGAPNVTKITYNMKI